MVYSPKSINALAQMFSLFHKDTLSIAKIETNGKKTDAHVRFVTQINSPRLDFLDRLPGATVHTSREIDPVISRKKSDETGAIGPD